ncbi:Transposon Ty3-G Gag-Pol polyprotein [Vitis vinifera]|uniref:Transposon Ty3-G Gag-Pol polyprotein n=1 Tax=Vitis vinifera TaxID=29760 RepID=A0A438HT02_VITVI|nr:Transposon Ty3-G Gag-Pol polyprotein [Vitis vinifera]
MSADDTYQSSITEMIAQSPWGQSSLQKESECTVSTTVAVSSALYKPSKKHEQAGLSKSQQPQTQRTTSRRTDKASFLGNVKFPFRSHTTRSDEEFLPAHQVQLDEGIDSTQVSTKKRRDRRHGRNPRDPSRSLCRNNYVGVALSLARAATSKGPIDRASPNSISWRIDQIVDAIIGHGMLSFIDSFSKYHQIPMFQSDEEKTTFITPHGLYCYKVMSFRLKNVGTTYQKLITKIFKSLIGRIVEVYIGNIVFKSGTRAENIQYIEETFCLMRAYNMKLDPTKCAFGVSA